MRSAPRRWTAAAWLCLFLMLFNVFNAATMGLRPMAGMAAGDMPLCAEHQYLPDAHHHHDPARPASSDCCSCCLSMCCTGAAVPDFAAAVPVPSLAWTALLFDHAQSSQRHPAPSIGGSARAPPVFA